MEGEGYDLIAMGRPEGEGCYCAANSLLVGFLEKLVNMKMRDVLVIASVVIASAREASFAWKSSTVLTD